ncbi:hypothetical protein EDB19DRAFT_400130 [Suillus lakei]|nr:hypothetical protein EDB19DRAFT_400130 [Suillus lakei]
MKRSCLPRPSLRYRTHAVTHPVLTFILLFDKNLSYCIVHCHNHTPNKLSCRFPCLFQVASGRLRSSILIINSHSLIYQLNSFVSKFGTRFAGPISLHLHCIGLHCLHLSPPGSHSCIPSCRETVALATSKPSCDVLPSSCPRPTSIHNPQQIPLPHPISFFVPSPQAAVMLFKPLTVFRQHRSVLRLRTWHHVQPPLDNHPNFQCFSESFSSAGRAIL